MTAPPQDEDVDAGIAAPGGRIPRQAEVSLCAAPWLDPWHGAALQFGNDAVRDLLIKAGARAPALSRASLCAGATLVVCTHSFRPPLTTRRGFPRKIPWAVEAALDPDLACLPP
jgi:hypothetical protein